VAVAAAAEKKEEELNAGVASSGRPPLGVQAVIWLVGAFGLPRLDRWGRHRWISAGIFKNPLEIQKNPWYLSKGNIYEELNVNHDIVILQKYD